MQQSTTTIGPPSFLAPAENTKPSCLTLPPPAQHNHIPPHKLWTTADVHYVQPSSAKEAKQICSSSFTLIRNRNTIVMQHHPSRYTNREQTIWSEHQHAGNHYAPPPFVSHATCGSLISHHCNNCVAAGANHGATSGIYYTGTRRGIKTGQPDPFGPDPILTCFKRAGSG